MGFRIFADATVVLHLGFVLFVIFGGLLVARCPWIAWIHLPSAAWGAWVEFAGWVCPLTPLENWLRQQGGGPGYTSSFIEHYLMPILLPILSLTRASVEFGRPTDTGQRGRVLVVCVTVGFPIMSH